jgi:hypothetical protein
VPQTPVMKMRLPVKILAILPTKKKHDARMSFAAIMGLFEGFFNYSLITVVSGYFNCYQTDNKLNVS